MIRQLNQRVLVLSERVDHLEHPNGPIEPAPAHAEPRIY